MTKKLHITRNIETKKTLCGRKWKLINGPVKFASCKTCLKICARLT